MQAAAKPNKAEARMLCNFDKPSSFMMVCADKAAKGKEHLLVVDYGKACIQLVENAGAIRNSSIRAVPYIPSPLT